MADNTDLVQKKPHEEDAAGEMLRLIDRPDELRIDPCVDAFVREADSCRRPWAMEAEGDLLKAMLFYMLLAHTRGMDELLDLEGLCLENRNPLASPRVPSDITRSRFGNLMEILKRDRDEARDTPLLDTCVLRYDRFVRALMVPTGDTANSAWIMRPFHDLMHWLVQRVDEEAAQRSRPEVRQNGAGANTEKEEEET